MSEQGRYLYSIVCKGIEHSFGDAGIEGKRVYTVPFEDISAVVHECKAMPYDTSNDQKAKDWVMAHGRVLDLATVEFGTVLPFPFDTIVKGDDETVKSWLKENHGSIQKAFERVKDKSEYSVHAFIDESRLEELIYKSMPEVEKIKAGLEKMSAGAGYLLKRRYELMVRDAKVALIKNIANDIVWRVMQAADEIKVEGKPRLLPESMKDFNFVANIACLVHRDGVDRLCLTLDRLEEEGIKIRFTGPWAPFSFSDMEGVR